MNEPIPARRPMPRTRNKPENTVDGCRALAAADLGRAAALDGVRMRWRFEHSAAAWTARAELLGRLEAKVAARIRRQPS